jgi:transcriptional regulator with XRE-family HTH domain
MSEDDEYGVNAHADGQEMEMITAWEFKRVLLAAGYSHSQLARHLNVSRSYVTGVANGYVRMTFRHTQELERFLGTRLFRASLAKVRKDRADAELRHRESARRHAEAEAARRIEAERRAAEERQIRAAAIEEELARSGSNSAEPSDGSTPQMSD